MQLTVDILTGSCNMECISYNPPYLSFTLLSKQYESNSRQRHPAEYKYPNKRSHGVQYVYTLPTGRRDDGTCTTIGLEEVELIIGDDRVVAW